jgi:hypothetical protein
LKNKFNLTPYVAIRVQSVDDIMIITKELRSSDYFLFIDFNRLSLFTHQEFALAHHLGFGSDVIALQQKGERKPDGFLKYVLSNPKEFQTTDELVEQVRELVKAKGWNASYSRNLVAHPNLRRSGGVLYGDHTGQVFLEGWQVKIENRRPDAAAVGAICILDTIRYPSGDVRPSEDRGYLKWAGHGGYERTILPNSSEEVSLFAIHRDRPGLFLVSGRDVSPRQPILTDNGDYELTYRLFARDFPVLTFTAGVKLRWQQTAPIIWDNKTEATLKSVTA